MICELQGHRLSRDAALRADDRGHFLSLPGLNHRGDFLKDQKTKAKPPRRVPFLIHARHLLAFAGLHLLLVVYYQEILAVANGAVLDRSMQQRWPLFVLVLMVLTASALRNSIVDRLYKCLGDATRAGDDVQRNVCQAAIAARGIERAAGGYSINGKVAVFGQSQEYFRGELFVPRYDHGSMVVQCQQVRGNQHEKCGAYFWKSETDGWAKSKWPCCSDSKGASKLPSAVARMVGYVPQEFSEFQADSPRGRELYENSRIYNHMFQFASASLNYDPACLRCNPDDPPAIRIQGRIHRYFANSTVAEAGVQPAFAHLYYMGDEQTATRHQRFGHNLGTIEFLFAALQEHNPIVKGTLQIADYIQRCADSNKQFTIIYDNKRLPPSAHPGTHNLPSNREGHSGVAAILSDDYQKGKAAKRSIIMKTSSSHKNVQQIYYDNHMFHPMHFPLLMPNGTSGWSKSTVNMEGDNESVFAFQAARLTQRFSARGPGIEHPCSTPPYKSWEQNTRKITCQEHMFTAGRAFQEMTLDAYTTCLDHDCSFYSREQTQVKFRSNMQACRTAEINGFSRIGSQTVLPKSHTGSPADYRNRFQNAMKLIMLKGKPDLFITMTTNPMWPEIQNELLPGETWHNRHDLVCRVYAMKLKMLINLIEKQGVFGQAAAVIGVTEFQKKSLPHVHLLICLENKLETAEQFDATACAEIPGERAPELRELVLRHMIHSPCIGHPTWACRKGPEDDRGASAPVDCRKKFPKEFCAETVKTEDEESYPSYRRRSPSDGGETGTTPVRGKQPGAAVDNSWVVPYNPALLMLLDCHVNVEVTSSIDCVKYLFKYVYKGNDRIIYKMRSEFNFGDDQVEEYRAARWLTPAESFFCLKFPRQRFHISPSVLPLEVHTADTHPVRIDPDEVGHDGDMTDAIASAVASPADTKLTRYFEYCKQNNNTGEGCEDLTYEQFPQHYRWEHGNWKRRGNALEQVGRMYRLTPRCGEPYYCRVLLSGVRGATGYESLKSGAETFQAACYDQGYIQGDDRYWNEALEYSYNVDNQWAYRHLFVMVLQHGIPANPLLLFETHRKRMASDYARSMALDAASERCQNRLLFELHRMMDSSDFGPEDQRPIPPRPDQSFADEEQAAAGVTEAKLRFESTRPQLDNDDEQFYAFDKITKRICSGHGGLFFLHAIGGAGKTTTVNCIMDWCTMNGTAVLSSATTGVAATLLRFGNTFHATTGAFVKLPSQPCAFKIGAETPTARRLAAARVLLIDEVTMMHHIQLDSLNLTCKHLASSAEDRAEPFGGKVIILCGDYQQQLPVVKGGNDMDVQEATLMNAECWCIVERLRLSTNHRLAPGAENEAFQEFTNRIGRGTEPAVNDTQQSILIPQNIRLDCGSACNEEQRIDALFDWLYSKAPATTSCSRVTSSMRTRRASAEKQQRDHAQWLCRNRVVTPKNKEVDMLNERAMKRFRGTQWVALSTDTMEPGEETARSKIPVKLLNSQRVPGMPPHKLHLQAGMPYALMRNYDKGLGLCNGTIVVLSGFDCTCSSSNVKHCTCRRLCISVTVPDSEHFKPDQLVRLPRIVFLPDEDDNIPFMFRRLQFPVAPSLACTIMKAQGQSLDRLGIYLPAGCFSHGQLYVAVIFHVLNHLGNNLL